ncbi:transducin family protein / WD-40 repeat family protein [Zea mays]|uniref:Transducin family protein / WD-40 repeat family protein n=1 Tax=Zea mays TaxID=4577 RepID=A0A1D6FQA4_MAIZE|nr:transducin family protein / WD-40 repeat family protein [Zea mays]
MAPLAPFPSLFAIPNPRAPLPPPSPLPVHLWSKPPISSFGYLSPLLFLVVVALLLMAPPNSSDSSTTSTTEDIPSSNQEQLVVIVHLCATVCVKSHIPMTLEMQNSNYTKWASHFKSLCCKFCLKPHIDGTGFANPTDPQWDQVD